MWMLQPNITVSPLIPLPNIITRPLTYAVTDKRLKNYSYRITQNIGPYVAVGAIIFITEDIERFSHA
jgi:hypothetical protein